MLKEVQISRGLALLFVSHDMVVVRFMADDIAIIDKGEVVEFGPSDLIFRAPQHPVTRDLIEATTKMGQPTQ